MFKSLKNNFKKAVSVSAALLLCFGAFAAIPKISVKAETAALYKDEFVSESGVFNTEAEGFPSSYIFDLSGLKKSWTASTSGFYARVPKKLFQAIRNGGKTVTLVDALGTHHIYRPEDISPKIDTLSSATFNVGTLYRKSKSYADTGNKIAAESGIDINSDTFKAWENFIFCRLFPERRRLRVVKYGLSRTAKTICPESLTAATAVTRNIFCVVRKTKAFLYMNTHPESLQKEQHRQPINVLTLKSVLQDPTAF